MTAFTQEQIKAHFEELPEVVQDAILDSNVPDALRDLYQSSNLHLDKWEILQRIVMSTLIGMSSTNALAETLKSELALDDEATKTLVEGLATKIFQPVRERLERNLGHPQAKDEELTDIEKVRQEALAAEKQGSATPPAPIPETPTVPGTPPPPKPDAKVVRGPASGAYKPGEASHERKGITDDPYREAVM